MQTKTNKVKHASTEVKLKKQRSLNSFSCISSNSLMMKQQSIMRQYKRLGFGESTPDYSIDFLQYTKLSNQMPEEILNYYNYSLTFQYSQFYEILSFAVFQYLFTNLNSFKRTIINELKQTICAKAFMEDSMFTKGLLLKGMKMLQRQAQMKQQIFSPVTQCLMSNDCMSAFTQFWKQLLITLGLNSSKKQSTNTQIFEVLAAYLGVDFYIYWKNSHDHYELEKIKSKNSVSNEFITIAINNINDDRHQNINILHNRPQIKQFSDISEIYSKWKYMLLIPSINVQKKNCHKMSFPSEDSAFEYSCGETQVIKAFFQNKILEATENKISKQCIKIQEDQKIMKQIHNIRKTMKKTDNLIAKFKLFVESIEDV